MAELCAPCTASFASPADLIAHVRRAHSGSNSRTSLALDPESRQPGLVCAMCGRRFASTKDLTRHHQTPHARTTFRPEPTRTRRFTYS